MQDRVDIQSDQKSKWVEKVMNVCGPVLLEADLEGTSLAAFDRIHAWDGNMDMEGIQSSLFEVFYMKLCEAVFKDELGEEFYPELASKRAIVTGVMDRIMEGQELAWCDDVSTEDTTESFRDLVEPAWNSAVKWLEKEYDTDMEAWIWGDIHRLSITHPLGSVKLLKKVFKLERGPYRVGGSAHTICPYTFPILRPFTVTDGASQRHIYNLVNPDDSRIIMPTGVSGIPASDFFCNQTDMYIRNEYILESFSSEKVEKNALFRSLFSASQHH